MSSTQSYAVLEIGRSAYAHIRALLQRAGYRHVFLADEQHGETINVQGIALAAKKPSGLRESMAEMEAADFFGELVFFSHNDPALTAERFGGLSPDARDLVARGMACVPADPILMVLHCPRCKAQHIDKPEPDIGWTNPPHRSHLCHLCGTVWRPASVATMGVEAVLIGEKDTWPAV